MILLIEPISKNIDMYVPAYPLPLMEIASFVKFNIPEVEIGIISMPMDYGLPLTKKGKKQIYQEFLKEISEIKPKGIGISCTAISQAEELIYLCELIKEHNPSIFIFLGGYFPTIYYEEVFSRTSAVDLIVTGEGEIPALKIIELLERGENPINEDIPNLAWKKDGKIHLTKKGVRFDLKKKALLNLELLRYPKAYDILPYAFSRGCPYHCNFCMEEYIRPIRKEVPSEIIHRDLTNLSLQSNTHTLLVSDALFKSFDLFPFLRSLGMKVNFETRCDVLDPSIIHQIADVCGMMALGFESASYNTLRRMNKVRDRAHYEKYISNTIAIFKEAVKYEIPIMVFMIAGYPGDTEKDLEESLVFARELSKNSGPGGSVFKVGECRVYPKTKLYDISSSLLDVVFDDDGVFGQNIVRQSSKGLSFETVLAYMEEIFNLSSNTPKLQQTILNMMPFFRLPAHALQDDMIPNTCFRGKDRGIFNVSGESLLTFRKLAPKLAERYKKWMSGQRSTRNLPF
ncbi:MAG TPA: cobalamin-dependent protein [Desulfatiglandales bacterium]|nr:cobalamin-dependent protein [Desulfatiglandales bacterium]